MCSLGSIAIAQGWQRRCRSRGSLLDVAPAWRRSASDLRQYEILTSAVPSSQSTSNGGPLLAAGGLLRAAHARPSPASTPGPSWAPGRLWSAPTGRAARRRPGPRRRPPRTGSAVPVLRPGAQGSRASTVPPAPPQGDTPWVGLATLVAMFVIPFLPSWLFEGPRTIRRRPHRHVCADCGTTWTAAIRSAS